MEKDQKGIEKEQGQSLVEFALSIVFILVILAGIVDLGRAFFAYVSVRDAAQEGAAFAAFCLYDETGALNEDRVFSRVRNSSTIPVDLTDTTDVAVTVVCTPACSADNTSSGHTSPGDTVSVTVSYSGFTLSMPFIDSISPLATWSRNPLIRAGFIL